MMMAEKEATLRDQFAMAGLAGGLEQGARESIDDNRWHSPTKIAQRAYSIADAMLKVRNARKVTT
jgi:hypothetical protein